MKRILNQIEPILTKQQLENDYKELGSLSAIAQKYGISNVTVRARFIKYGIPFITKNQKNKCNHDIFSEDSERAFYLAGFIAADGCIRISKTNNSNYTNHRIVIGLAERDEDFLKFLQTLFESNHKLNYYTHKMSKYCNRWNDSNSVKLSITSKQMVEDLRRFNIVPRKSLMYTFPKWIENHELRSHFMRGYFDGDGSFYINSELSYDRLCCSIRGTSDFLNVYKNILKEECGDGGYVDMHSSIAMLCYKGKLALKVRDFLYQNSIYFLERKKMVAYKIMWKL